MKDPQQGLAQAGFSGGVGSHENNGFFIAEPLPSGQMFLLNDGVYDFFGVGKIDAEIFKAINMVQR